MAKVKKKNLFTEGHTGKAGKMVFKYRNKTQYFSHVPDMSNVIPTDNQINNRSNFASAVEYAHWIKNWLLANPDAKLPFEVKKHQSLFNAAVSHYRKTNKVKASDSTFRYRYTGQTLKTLKLSDRQIKAVLYLQKKGKLNNSIYQEINDVSKATATRDLQDLVTKKIIIYSGTKGAGATYEVDFSNFRISFDSNT